MATVSSLVVSARGVGNPSRKPYFVQTTLDFSHADIDALSAGDIVQAITCKLRFSNWIRGRLGWVSFLFDKHI